MGKGRSNARRQGKVSEGMVWGGGWFRVCDICFFVHAFLVTMSASYAEHTQDKRLNILPYLLLEFLLAVDERDDELIAGRLLGVCQHSTLRVRPWIERERCVRKT